MKASEIRAELLGQHGEIRQRIAEIRQALARRPLTDAARDEGEGRIAQLIGLLRRHNAREEELLRDVLPTVDAWGPARAEIMLEEHAKEHDALYAALADAGALPRASGPAVEAAHAKLAELMDRVLSHIAHEEKIILSEEVLRDDGIVRDYFGG